MMMSWLPPSCFQHFFFLLPLLVVVRKTTTRVCVVLLAARDGIKMKTRALALWTVLGLLCALCNITKKSAWEHGSDGRLLGIASC